MWLGWWLADGLFEKVLRSADGSWRMTHNEGYSYRTNQAMSELQLSALLAKLKEDVALREKLRGAADLDAALVLTKEAGFDVTKAEWIGYQANRSLELSDQALEGVAGGTMSFDEFECPR